MNYCCNCQSYLVNDVAMCSVCGYQPKVVNDIPVYASELADDNDGFSSDDHVFLTEVENGHFWFENRNLVLRWILQKFFPQMGSFCEVGCGTGFVLREIAKSFPDVKLFASDIYVNALSFVQKKVPNAKLFQSDLMQFPYIEKFDVVGAFDVIEHIDDDVGALESIYRSLVVGGGVVITIPQHKWLWSVQDISSCHKRRYYRKDIIDKMESVGFRVLKVTSFVSLLLPLMIVSRLLFLKELIQILEMNSNCLLLLINYWGQSVGLKE